jgi:hypothetical protein
MKSSFLAMSGLIMSLKNLIGLFLKSINVFFPKTLKGLIYDPGTGRAADDCRIGPVSPEAHGSWMALFPADADKISSYKEAFGVNC